MDGLAGVIWDTLVDHLKDKDPLIMSPAKYFHLQESFAIHKRGKIHKKYTFFSFCYSPIF